MKLWSMEQRLRKAYTAEHRLLSIHMDLIYTCDLSCTHCYLDDKYPEQLSTEKVIEILREAREMGALKLTLSGGELFLRKDLFQILEEASSLRFYIRLKTHGGHITAENAMELKRLGINQVDVSLYAIDETIHNAVAQRKNAFERTLRGIDHLLAAGVPVKANCSVMKTNRDHYEELVHAMKERGVDWGLEASIRATDSGDTGTYDLGLGLEERSEVERFKRSQWNARMGKMQIGGDEHICAAGITNVHVQPNGAITPCVVWPMEVGHLEEGSLSHIWKNAPLLQEVRDTRRKDRDGCQSCALDNACRFCPGKAYTENGGNWLEPARLQCADTASLYYGGLMYNQEEDQGTHGRKLPVIPSPVPGTRPPIGFHGESQPRKNQKPQSHAPVPIKSP